MSKMHRQWRKSSYSDPNGECVEVTEAVGGNIGVRDSKAGTTDVVLEFSRAEWSRLLIRLRNA